MVEGEDYESVDLVDNILFSNTAQDTQTFYFNEAGLAALQSWVDYPETNQGLAFVEADVERMLIATKEDGVASRRPVLTLYYLGDDQVPSLIDTSPNDGEKILPVDVDIAMTFDEYIWPGT